MHTCTYKIVIARSSMYESSGFAAEAGAYPVWRKISVTPYSLLTTWKSLGLVFCLLLYVASKYIWFNIDQLRPTINYTDF